MHSSSHERERARERKSGLDDWMRSSSHQRYLKSGLDTESSHEQEIERVCVWTGCAAAATSKRLRDSVCGLDAQQQQPLEIFEEWTGSTAAATSKKLTERLDTM